VPRVTKARTSRRESKATKAKVCNSLSLSFLLFIISCAIGSNLGTIQSADPAKFASPEPFYFSFVCFLPFCGFGVALGLTLLVILQQILALERRKTRANHQPRTWAIKTIRINVVRELLEGRRTSPRGTTSETISSSVNDGIRLATRTRRIRADIG
jgi:hypothetical protein